MRYRTSITIWAVAMLGVVLGCSAQPSGDEASPAQDTQSVNTHTSAASGPEVVTGTVVESMDAAGYTYIRVDTGYGEALFDRFLVGGLVAGLSGTFREVGILRVRGEQRRSPPEVATPWAGVAGNCCSGARIMKNPLK